MAALEPNKVLELTDQARAGNRAAFSELVRNFMTPVVALTYRMTGSRDTAKDLAQEAFISAWEHLKEFRGDAKFESWIYRIAVNKTLHFLESRKNQPHEDVADSVVAVASTASPEEAAADNELRRDVLAFMQLLPEQQRLVFDLRFYKQMQFEEIAEATDKALGTVKTLYREAVKKLREHAVQKGWR